MSWIRAKAYGTAVAATFLSVVGVGLWPQLTWKLMPEDRLNGHSAVLTAAGKQYPVTEIGPYHPGVFGLVKGVTTGGVSTGEKSGYYFVTIKNPGDARADSAGNVRIKFNSRQHRAEVAGGTLTWSTNAWSDGGPSRKATVKVTGHNGEPLPNAEHTLFGIPGATL